MPNAGTGMPNAGSRHALSLPNRFLGAEFIAYLAAET